MRHGACFHNAYWNKHRAGIYVDIVTGEPLFSSLDKFDCGTRLAQFYKADREKRSDRKSPIAVTGWNAPKSAPVKAIRIWATFLTMARRQPASVIASIPAALRLFLVEKMKEEGYGDYLALFDQKKKNRSQP